MHWLTARLNAVRYRTGGLPISLIYLRRPPSDRPGDLLRHAYAKRFWRIRRATDALEIIATLAFAPFLLLGAAIWHTSRCGAVHARKSGRPIWLQFIDQLRIYAVSGVMPASYYIYSLPDRPTGAHARSFLKRAEAKGLIYMMVRERMPRRSTLNDKAEFATYCRSVGLPVVPTIAIARAGKLDGSVGLPQRDLFLKPLNGKGGRGAERWEWVGGDDYRSATGETLTAGALIAHIARRSLSGDVIIQPRLVNHRSLSRLNSGALATIRVLTCLDGRGEPEVIGAALRMAVRATSVVDNLHSGGIAAAIDVGTGKLSRATNLGKDASVGWLDRHPVSQAKITGRRLTWWPQVRDLALKAHGAYQDRLFVGWDIAMTPDGPMLVEGNSAPGLDIFQRPALAGMMDGRFVELLAERLVRSGEGRRAA